MSSYASNFMLRTVSGFWEECVTDGQIDGYTRIPMTWSQGRGLIDETSLSTFELGKVWQHWFSIEMRMPINFSVLMIVSTFDMHILNQTRTPQADQKIFYLGMSDQHTKLKIVPSEVCFRCIPLKKNEGIDCFLPEILVTMNRSIRQAWVWLATLGHSKLKVWPSISFLFLLNAKNQGNFLISSKKSCDVTGQENIFVY